MSNEEIKSELQAIALSKPDLIKALQPYDPVETASAISGLMTFSELQSNSYRLEVLIHIAMSVCQGTQKPRAKDVARWFTEVGEGFCGMQEDPAEDVFVFNIMSPRGNFLVLEGLWEGGGFNLQQVINTVENMPRGDGYDELRESIYALLKMSNEVCMRAGLKRYQLGSDLKVNSLPRRIKNAFPRYKNFTKFKRNELAALDINVDQLASFGFLPSKRAHLIEQSISFSDLEREPVCARNDCFYLMLPNAVSAAIRNLVFDQMNASNMHKNLVRGLANEHSETFSRMPILGWKMGAPFIFQNTPSGLVAEVSAEVDSGHHLQIIAMMDDFDGFVEGGLGSIHELSDEAEQFIEKRVDNARQNLAENSNLKNGITVVVMCGLGRGFSYNMPRIGEGWSVIGLSAYDFYTLSWIDKFEPMSLWRLHEAQQKVAASGVMLMNINGLMNLLAWREELDGHLVPHNQIPDDYVGDGNLMIMINQNGIRNLRGKVFEHHDFHCLPDIGGKYVKVLKLRDSMFEEDLQKPIYVTESFIDDGLPLAYSGESSLWWATLEIRNNEDSENKYERWKLLGAWFPKIAAVFEKSFKGELPQQIYLKLECATTFGSSRELPKRLTYEEVRAEVTSEVDHDAFKIVIQTSKKYESGFFHPENIAERALVEECVAGISQLLGGVATERQAMLTNQIVESVHARQTHAFEASEFRDFVRPTMNATPTPIHNDDITTMKYDLGWRVRDRKLGGKIEGKEACIAFLNALVVDLVQELCDLLSGFNRVQLGELAIGNHETAEFDKKTWRRTSAAVLALHENKDEALHAIVNHESRLNAVFQSCRILLEMIPHECPLDSGEQPSRFEFSRLMARVMEITSLGGWSDAIRWDAMEPTIHVMPLGDVYGNLDFFDNVIDKFGKKSNQRIIENEVEKYEELFEEPKVIEEISEGIEIDFENAVEREFGVPLQDLRRFNDICENAFIEKRKAFRVLRKSQLVELLAAENILTAEKIDKIVTTFTFKVRKSWKTIPEGFRDTDRQPWRFRRRLSILRNPIVALDDVDDPSLLVAPGVIRDAFAYLVGNFHSGDFADYQVQSKEMRKWVGKSRARREKLNGKVAEKLRRLGWKTKSDLKVTELLGKGEDQKFGNIKLYGDIDVLAWSENANRVLVLECKDVQFKKTPGEIAEQLSKFRGEIYSDGKPDRLRRHLDRVTIAEANIQAISRITGLNKFSIEGGLVFRNPVPMRYASEFIQSRTELVLFSEIAAKFAL